MSGLICDKGMILFLYCQFYRCKNNDKFRFLLLTVVETVPLVCGISACRHNKAGRANRFINFIYRWLGD